MKREICHNYKKLPYKWNKMTRVHMKKKLKFNNTVLLLTCVDCKKMRIKIINNNMNLIVFSFSLGCFLPFCSIVLFNKQIAWNEQLWNKIISLSKVYFNTLFRRMQKYFFVVVYMTYLMLINFFSVDLIWMHILWIQVRFCKFVLSLNRKRLFELIERQNNSKAWSHWF